MSAVPILDAGSTYAERFVVAEAIHADLGQLYRARDGRSFRPILLWILPGPAVAQDHAEDVVRRSRALQHDGIVRLSETGLWRNSEGELWQRWVTMNVVEGKTLRQVLDIPTKNHEPVTVSDAIEILVAIMETLTAAHVPDGMMHRHLRPTNIFLQSRMVGERPGWSVKILGFGISELMSSETFASVRSSQYDAGPFVTGSRVDTDTVGVLFYEMLTGRPPRGTYLPPSEIRDLGKPPAPQLIDALVENALRGEFSSAAHMLVDARALRTAPSPSGQLRPLFTRIVTLLDVALPLVAVGIAWACATMERPSLRWGIPVAVVAGTGGLLSAFRALVRHGYGLSEGTSVRFVSGQKEMDGVVVRVAGWFTELRAEDGSVARVSHLRFAAANVRRLDVDGMSWVDVHVHAERASFTEVEDAFHALKQSLSVHRGFDSSRSLEWALVAVDAATCSWVLRVPIAGHRFVRTMEDVVLGGLAGSLEDALVLASTQPPRGRVLTAGEVDSHSRQRAQEVARLVARWGALGHEPIDPPINVAHDVRSLRSRVIEQEKLYREVRVWEECLRALGDVPRPLSGHLEPARVHEVRARVVELEAHRVRAQDVDDTRTGLGLPAWSWHLPISADQLDDALFDTYAAELRLAEQGAGTAEARVVTTETD